MCWLWPGGHLSLPSWVLGLGGPGAQSWPQRQPWGNAKTGLRGQPAPTAWALRPAQRRLRQNPGLMFSSGVIPAAPRLPGRICVQLPPSRSSGPSSDLNFVSAREMICASARASTLDSALTPTGVHPRATPLYEAPRQAACSPLGPGSRCSLGAWACGSPGRGLGVLTWRLVLLAGVSVCALPCGSKDSCEVPLPWATCLGCLGTEFQ